MPPANHYYAMTGIGFFLTGNTNCEFRMVGSLSSIGNGSSLNSWLLRTGPSNTDWADKGDPTP